MPDVIGLLLAAGAGRRMGLPKALVEGSDGIPWVISSVRTLAAGGCGSTVVVIGAASQSVRSLLATEDVTVVEAVDWEQGMGASLRAGLRAITDFSARTPHGAIADSAYAGGTPTDSAYIGGGHADAALVHLVDLPDVGPAVIRRILAYAAPGMLARASYGSGAPGHPVLLGKEHWATIAATASGDRGARDYLAHHEVIDVDCSDLATGADVDARVDSGAPGASGPTGASGATDPTHATDSSTFVPKLGQ
jgi:CTP:molybdopterin cytidylyltransferase MocA